MSGLWAQSYSEGMKFATITFIIQFYTNSTGYELADHDK